MIQSQESQFTYENLGYQRNGTKKNAPLFTVEPITFKDVRSGKNIITTVSNVDAGTIPRGALAIKARTSSFIVNVSDVPYQISSPVSKMAMNLIVAESGGTSQTLEGWTMYDDYPVKDRRASYNSTYQSSGIAIDHQYIYFAAETNLYRMPLDMSSYTQLTGTITTINGLASDGLNLYTVNGTNLYQISISGTTFTVTTKGLSFNVSKLAAYNGKYFIGYDSTNNVLRVFDKSGNLWRNIPYLENTFLGGLTYQGFFYLATQVGNQNVIQLLPILII